MKVYKVFRVFNGQLKSVIAVPPFSITYLPGKPYTGVFAYDNLSSAQMFATSGANPLQLVIWECEAEKAFPAKKAIHPDCLYCISRDGHADWVMAVFKRRQGQIPKLLKDLCPGKTACCPAVRHIDLSPHVVLCKNLVLKKEIPR